MGRAALFSKIQDKKSFLCVGLDPDLDKIPTHLLDSEDPIFEFNKAIIDATQDLCVAYKPNLAFFEAEGLAGWRSFEKTVQYIPDDILVIADAKRGDIGNTSQRYAKAFFEKMNCDAITIAPYMGEDSVIPFLGFDSKWVILLGLTSNKGSQDFQFLGEEKKLYQYVMEKSSSWASSDEMMYVVGATHPEKFKEIRSIVPEYFFLVPGVGAQGGDLQKIAQHGMNDHCGLLVNSSRGIIYAGGKGKDFVEGVRHAALDLQEQMQGILIEHNLI